MYLASVNGAEALRLLRTGALLVDIRDGAERARMHIPGSVHASVNQPLPRIDDAVPAVVFHCSRGHLAEDNAYRLKDITDAPAYLLRGGLDAWVQEGLPVVTRGGVAQIVDRHSPALMGALAFGGALLALAAGPGLDGLSLAMDPR